MKSLFQCFGLLLMGFGIQPIFAQNVSLDWAAGMGSNSMDQGKSVAVDDLGNVYSTGLFSGRIDFDPGPDTFFLESMNSFNTDVFIQKLDSSGNFVWAKSVGGAYADVGAGIALGPAGEVYITGHYNHIVDFDPGIGIHQMTSVHGDDIFILKLDPAGNFIWARSMGGRRSDRALSICTDAFGNVLTTGQFEDSSDFDPGPGVNLHISRGFSDVFIQKIDASGNFVWAQSVGGKYADHSWAIASDANGQVYVTGDYQSQVDFDPGAGSDLHTAQSGNDAFVLKLTDHGNWVWANTMGGHNGDLGRAIHVDAFDQVYVVGRFSHVVDFDPGPDSLILRSEGQWNSFIQKLDSNGHLQWAKALSGTDLNEAFGVMTGPSGYPYIAGAFSDKVDFDPGPDSLMRTSFASAHDIYLLKLNPSGDVQWATTFEGDQWNIPYALASDASENIFLVGVSLGMLDFDPHSDTLFYTSTTPDLFVLKLDQDIQVGSPEWIPEKTVSIFPNPGVGTFYLNGNGLTNLSLRVFSGQGVLLEEINDIQDSVHPFTIHGPAGIYLVEVFSGENGQEVFRLIKND